MTPFEEELRKALTRSEPSDDFTAKLLAAAHARETAAAKRRIGSALFWRLVPAVALVIVLFSAAFGYRERVRRVKGEEAKEQLLMAIHIASIQLHAAQVRVNKIESSEAVMK